MNQSLFNRVFLSLLILLILIMVASAYTLTRNLIEKSTHAYLQDSRDNVALVTHSLTGWIEEQKSLTLAISDDAQIAKLLQNPSDEQLYDDVQQRLKALHERAGYFENIGLIINLPEGTRIERDLHGHTVSIGNGNIFMDTVEGKTIGKASVERDFVHHSMILGETYISTPYPSILRGNPVFVISSPIYRADGSIAGIVATAPILDRFSKKFTSHIKMGEHGFAFICDRNGNIISHPDQSKLLKENFFLSLEADNVNYDNGMTLNTRENGNTVWYTFRKEPVTQWHVIGKIYRDDIYNAFQSEIIMIIASIMIITFLLAVGGWWLIRREVIRPLEEVRLALMNFSPTTAIESKNLSSPASLEFRQIHDSLLKMSAMFHSYLSAQKKLEEEIRHHAMYDQLTELPNRRFLYSHIETQLHTAAKEGSTFALFFLDLDHFKLINDALGHDIGDNLLQETAKRLRAQLSHKDLLARLGGDEFIIVVTSLQTRKEFENLARKIVKVMHEKLIVENHETHEFIISTSLGISIYPDHGSDLKTLMKHADIALYEAKEEGRNSYCLFNDSMNELIRNQLYLEQDMREALKKGQYTLFFQPQIDAKSSRVIGAEALIRWNHPEQGIISPIRFIHLAENTGFIYELGDWILEEACRTLSQWQEFYTDFKLSINISARQFQNRDFISKVHSRLSRFSIKPGTLVFEITETLLMAQKERSMEVLNALKEMGITIAMDDFGTGYSSLAYLKNFPIDIIKIDKAFIQGVFDNPDDFNIVKAIITLGNELELQVIAEGVEELHQLEFLQASHCHIIQGYFFSKPLPEDEFITYIGDSTSYVSSPLKSNKV